MRKEKFIYIGLAVIIAVMLFLDGSFSLTDRSSSVVYSLSDLKLTQIDLQCEVFITHGNNEKLVLEAPEDILNKLDINQHNGILSIRTKKGTSLFNLIGNMLNRSGKIKIYINHSELDRIIVNNEAKIISVDYKSAQYHANSFEEEEEGNKRKSYFKVASLADVKQRVVKSLIERTIFRIYSSI